MRQIAFERNIQVRLLASYWNHTDPVMMNYLQSLKMFSSNIDVVSHISLVVVSHISLVFYL